MTRIRKTELVVFVVLLLLYINKITGFTEIPFFGTFNILAFLIISIAGFKLYRTNIYQNKTKAVIFAVACGIAFAMGIFAFGTKVYNHQNISVIIFGFPNLVLFVTLIVLFKKSKKNEVPERAHYFKSLLIRSTVILCLCLVIILLPFRFINLYLNRDNPHLHNRGLAHRYYDASIKLSEEKKYDESLAEAEKALAAFKIGYNNNIEMYYEAYEALYNAYWGLILKKVSLGEDEKAIEYIDKIDQPLHIWFGDSSRQEAALKTVTAELFQRREDYKVADSLYIDALHIYKSYFGRKNIYYSLTLQLLANSYREQHYYTEAIDLYKSVIYLLEKDTMAYTSSKEGQADNIITNAIASANADLGWTYSLKENYDTAEIYFKKAFETKTYSAYRDYSSALGKYAYYTLYRGEFHKAKTLMQNAVKLVAETKGENNYDYLYVLDGLNVINTALANYTEAEKGCNKALAILKEITAKRNNYYASLILQLAFVKHRQGFYEKAEELFKEALVYTSKGSIQYADVLVALSDLKCDLTKYTEAFELAEQASQKAHDFYGDHHPASLIKYWRCQAYINYLSENTDAAERLYLKCYGADTSNNILNKISYGSTLNGLGLIKTRRKKFTEADTLFDRTLIIYEKQMGKDNPDYATVLYNKAYLKFSEANITEAEALFEQAITIITKTLNSKHDKVADNLIGLGEIKLKQNKKLEALPFFTKALEIYKTKFKPEHKKYILALNCIKLCK